MNFRNGLNSRQTDFNAYLGDLTFLNLRREDTTRDDDGNVTGIRKRVYNVISSQLRKVIQISVPADVEEKKFMINQPVRLKEPVRNFMSQINFPNVDVVEYITAEDIVPISGKNSTQQGNQNQAKASN